MTEIEEALVIFLNGRLVGYTGYNALLFNTITKTGFYWANLGCFSDVTYLTDDEVEEYLSLMSGMAVNWGQGHGGS